MLPPFTLPPATLLLLAPFAGSFLGVVTRRLPRGESIVRPRSHCEACGRTLRAGELVPLLSYLALRGRCRGCGAPIGRDHLLMEIAATLVAASVLVGLPDAGWPPALAGCALGWCLLALGAIDWACWRLPDVLTLPLMVGALAWTSWWSPGALADHAAAAALGWGGLACLAVLYRRLRGRAGLGLGDAKLLGAGGAATGLEGLGPVLLLASLAGLALALLRHGRGARAGSAVPFGPALSVAIFVVWVFETRAAAAF